MPIYTYECTQGHIDEVWQSINARPRRYCVEEPGCTARARRIIVPTGGHVMEPNGIYQPFPDMRMDPKTKRLGEEKVTKRAYEKQDREHRDRMLRNSRNGPKLDLEPKKEHTWF